MFVRLMRQNRDPDPYRFWVWEIFSERPSETDWSDATNILADGIAYTRRGALRKARRVAKSLFVPDYGVVSVEEVD